MELLVFVAVLVLLPFVLLITDRMGWTAVYAKGRGRGAASNVLLGMDSLFAPENRRAAIEYRVDKQDAWREAHAGDDHDGPGDRPQDPPSP